LKEKNFTIVLVLLVLFCVLFAQTAVADDLIVVTSPSTQQGSQKWFDFLMAKEVPVKVVNPKEFGNYKQEKYIVIMGSMDESEDIKAILRETLSGEEFQWVSENGNGKMYLKSDKWAQDQHVIVFAGYSQRVAEAVRKGNREDWFEKIMDWFGIESDEVLPAY
jgi:hypothetical protein